jgi:hypothetical protein
MEPKIQNLIDAADNVEVIRDQIAAILKLEIENQYQKSQDDEYNIKIFIENARPVETETDEGAELSRFINAQLSRVDIPKSNSRIGRQAGTATFFIDCTAYGSSEGDYRDDKEAAFKAWRIARLVRNIIMCEPYTYLGMQGVVRSRIITTMETGAPNMQSEAQATTIVRVTLEVDFIENTFGISYDTLELINFTCNSATGEVLVKLDFDYKEA